MASQPRPKQGMVCADAARRLCTTASLVGAYGSILKFCFMVAGRAGGGWAGL